MAALALSLATGICFVALSKRWMTVDLAAASFFPLLLPTFDEISTASMTPFIVLRGIVMTTGILLYQLWIIGALHKAAVQ